MKSLRGYNLLIAVVLALLVILGVILLNYTLADAQGMTRLARPSGAVISQLSAQASAHDCNRNVNPPPCPQPTPECRPVRFSDVPDCSPIRF